MTERTCLSCGKVLVRKKRAKGMERPQAFAIRKFCDNACRAVHKQEARWTEDAVAELTRLRELGMGAQKIADELRRGGFGRFTRSAVKYRLYRPIREERKPAPPEPIRFRPPGSGGCRVMGCRSPKQPGREYCAHHHSELVVSRRPRTAGGSSLYVGGGASSLV